MAMASPAPRFRINAAISSGVGTDYTDEDGWANFSIITETIGNGVIPIRRIWVNGEEVSDDVIYPDDGDTFSFTLPE
jgi:hypothetical protein